MSAVAAPAAGPRSADALRRRVVAGVGALALGALALSGESSALIALIAGVAWAAGLLRGGAPGADALHLWRIANTSALVMAIIAVFLVSSRLAVGAALVSYLLVHRAWTGRSATDDRVSLLLSTLLLLLSCILSLHPALMLVFAGFGLLAPHALMLCLLSEHLPPRAAAPRLGALWAVGPAVLALSGALFVVLPRVQGGVGAGLGPEALPGFQDRVQLGDHAMSRFNPDEVLRATITDQDGAPVLPPIYMRGVAMDTFDGAGWQREPFNPQRLNAWPAEPGTPRWWRSEVSQVNHTNDVLFAPPEVHAVRPEGESFRLRMDMSRNLRGAAAIGVLRYTTWSVPYAPGEPPADSKAIRQREAGLARLEAAVLKSQLWTELPEDLDPEIGALAVTLAEQAGPGAGPALRAAAVVRHLSGFSYTLDPQPEHAGQPLSAFLFESQAGHCEYFATALAVLLRAQGTPARVVNGLYGGELNPYGGFVVFRQQDAHSWVEAWIDGRWVLLDATPALDGGASRGLLAQLSDLFVGGTRSLMLDFDLSAQLGGLSRLAEALRGQSGAVRGLAAVAVVIGVWVGVRRGLKALAGPAPGPAPGQLARRYADGLALARARGWTPPVGLPPLRQAEAMVAAAGPELAPLAVLAWLSYRETYGGEPASALLPEAAAALAALRALPKRPRATPGEPAAAAAGPLRAPAGAQAEAPEIRPPG